MSEAFYFSRRGFVSAAGLAALSAALASRARAQTPPQVEITVLFPARIVINRDVPGPRETTSKQTATGFLKNNSPKVISLSSPTPCDVQHWQIADASGRVVLERKPGVCVAKLETYDLKPGETLRAEQQVVLDATILEKTASFTLRYEFWSFRTEKKFDVEVVG
jgi:hypothetical protein